MTNSIDIDYAKVALKLASVLGRKYRVNIVFSGDEAKTDGRTVYLPHWDFKNPRTRNALYGLIFHEAAGHVRNTQFGVFQNYATTRTKRAQKYPIEIWHAAFNILEDIRIERMGIREYAGANSLLNAVCEVVFEDYTPPEKVNNHWSLGLNWAILNFRNRILGQKAVSSMAQLYDKAATEYFGSNVLASAMKIAEQAAVAPLTEPVLTLAEELITLFGEAVPQEQSQDGRARRIGRRRCKGRLAGRQRNGFKSIKAAQQGRS